MLTESQRNDYLTNDSGRCPFCKSDNIQGHAIDICGKEAIQPVTCSDCGHLWNDIYSLTDVEDLDD